MPTDAYAHTRADSIADSTTCADTYANANTISNAVTVADEVRREAHDDQAWRLHSSGSPGVDFVGLPGSIAGEA